MGDKSVYRFVGDYLAKSTGAVVLVPNYQKFPDVKFPVFVDEAWKVVEWALANSESYGAHTDSYSVIGHSSGAHTAAMVAVGARRPSNLPLPEKCVSLAGPNCFVGKELQHVFGASIEKKTAFPNDLVARTDENYETKFLLLQGRYDQVIYYRQQTDFLANLAARNIEAELIKTQTTHVGQIVSIGSPFGRFTKSARLVRRFLRNES
jgi:carboxylesterase type B